MVETAKLIPINNMNNSLLNFDCTLDTNKSLLIKKCNGLTIIINNKINKITIEKSYNITVIINKLITGLEIDNSNNIIISMIDMIPSIDIFKSRVFLNGPIENYGNVLITSDKSWLYNISHSIK
jgi:hypothetical protein